MLLLRSYPGEDMGHPPFNQLVNVKNQFTGFGYDAAGNMTSNGSNSYTYDGEGRLVTAGGFTYTYDGDGRRVKKASGSTGTLYWPDTAGNTLSESNLSGSLQEEYFFFNGKRVARRDVSNDAVHYFFPDHLGSTSVITNSTGATIEQDLDYFPYGGVAYGAPSDHYLFTGKERDAESGLDNFDFRYYSSAMGRFTRPDEPFAGWDQHDPQSFNLYSYAENNPVTNTDPDGHDVQVCVSDNTQKSGQKCFTLTDKQYADLQKQQNGQNGINMPGGTFPSGNITCGGQVCGTARYFEPGLKDESLDLFLLGDSALSLGKLGIRGLVGLFSKDAAEEGTVVIGKVADLNAEGALAKGERTLDLPDLGDPKANWGQNSSRLREAMNEGKPIRDASANPLEAGKPGKNTGFLRAERNLLENHGWTYSNGYWRPPSK